MPSRRSGNLRREEDFRATIRSHRRLHSVDCHSHSFVQSSGTHAKTGLLVNGTRQIQQLADILSVFRRNDCNWNMSHRTEGGGQVIRPLFSRHLQIQSLIPFVDDKNAGLVMLGDFFDELLINS